MASKIVLVRKADLTDLTPVTVLGEATPMKREMFVKTFLVSDDNRFVAEAARNGARLSSGFHELFPKLLCYCRVPISPVLLLLESTSRRKWLRHRRLVNRWSSKPGR